MCGIFGITNTVDAAALTAIGLHALQHRGQEGAGIATLCGEQMRAHRSVGLVSDTFADEHVIASLVGTVAIGHVRYSTSGAKHSDPEMSKRSAQPFVTKTAFGVVALVHNGNLTNAETLRRELIAEGHTFESDSDSEVALKLIARSRKESLLACVRDMLQRIEGAYTFLIMSAHGLIAVRDSYGTRPLVLGKRNGSYVCASESGALNAVKALYVDDIEPGELLCVHQGCVVSERFASTSIQPCAFEWIYFMRPDHHLPWGESVYEVRERVGAMLARARHQEVDLVVPVLDSGLPFGLGYARVSGVPFAPALVRNHYAVGRAFMQPTRKGRDSKVRNKHSVIASLVRDKRIALIDDSAVRGTTSRLVVELLMEAGAREVHLVLAYPPFVHGCPSGIDVPKRSQLFAAGMTDVREVERVLCMQTKATSVQFPHVADVLACIHPSGTMRRADVCMGCVDGTYPFALTDEKYKAL